MEHLWCNIFLSLYLFICIILCIKVFIYYFTCATYVLYLDFIPINVLIICIYYVLSSSIKIFLIRYKILFLDVLFPLDVKKFIFVDADQVFMLSCYSLIFQCNICNICCCCLFRLIF